MKNYKHITSLIIPAAFLLGSYSAQAAITYVDAQEGGNTFSATETGTTWIETASDSSNLNNSDWVLRSNTPTWSFNGDTAIQGRVDPIAGNTLGEITTEVTGLADGIYDVYAFFWDFTPVGNDWLIDVGLTSGSLTAYNEAHASTVLASTLSFSNAPTVTFNTGDFEMIGVLLGQSTVSGGSAINVYIDKLTGVGGAERTMYDGIGYSLVPEPSALALVGLVALGLLARRRR